MSVTEGKVIKCRAAVAWEPLKPLSIEEVEVAPPKKNEVRVKIVATGVCHSDEGALRGNNPDAVFPVILGHEAAGIVESVGEGVTKFQPGDHVIPLFMPVCTKCDVCKSGKSNKCAEFNGIQSKGVLFDGTSRFTCKGKSIAHFIGVSSFSEYTVVSDISLAKISDKAPLDKVCLLGCCIPTGYGAAINAAKVEPGSVCAVWGLGGVGLATAMGCKNAGASKVYGIDINPEKFEIGKKFGITDFINPKEVQGSLVEHLVKLTGGGFDYTFEAIGNINTMQVAFESLHPGWGTLTVIGLAPPGQTIPVTPMLLLIGHSIKGTLFGGYKGTEGVPKLVDDYLNKKLLVDEFITHTRPLEKINEGFELLRAGKSIRTVILY